MKYSLNEGHKFYEPTKPKLRLLITPDCNRNCVMCCNKNFDLDSLPSIEQADEFAQYSEISITGGEPMLVYDKLRETLMYIMEYGDFKGQINLYTAMPDHPKIYDLFRRCNITFTIHDKKALIDVLAVHDNAPINNRSVRVKLAPAVHRYFKLMDKLIDDVMWEVEKFDWIEDCPLPDGEVFMRI